MIFVIVYFKQEVEEYWLKLFYLQFICVCINSFGIKKKFVFLYMIFGIYVIFRVRIYGMLNFNLYMFIYEYFVGLLVCRQMSNNL